MSTPPPPGWQPQQPGQPPYGSQPGGFPPPGPPNGYPQGSWPPPQPPKGGGNTTKWLLIAIAVLLVVGVTIGATLLFTRGTGDATTNPSSTQSGSEFASAGDVGPVSIITNEPTCKTFNTINNGLAEITKAGWGDSRDKLGPASEWTPEQRDQLAAVASAMRNAADQAVPLAKQTPHRLMRELYSQFIAYGRAYADSVATYVPENNSLASANVSATSALIGICNAIEFESTRRSLSLSSEPPPTEVEPAGGIPGENLLIESPSKSCDDWVARLDAFTTSTPEWQVRDGTIPGAQWTADRRQLEKATVPLLEELMSDLVATGRGSGNPVMEDFAVATSVYIHAYIAAIDSYTSEDSWLIYAGFGAANLVSAACRAAEK